MLAISVGGSRATLATEKILMILLIAIAQVICKIEFRLILLIIQTDAGESSAKKKFMPVTS